ncbi:MAG: response regulator [Dehalococcoidia bacterium]|nr:response regulator [Dehalococcoidia bacterium]
MTPDSTTQGSEVGDSVERRRRICLIDDDASFRRLADTILAAEGYECVLVEDLSRASELARACQPDIVMMDLRLGQEVDALQVLLDIAKPGSGTERIPVLVCTASRDLVQKHQDLLDELGCRTLEKPFNIEDLLAAIRACLESA